MMMSEILDELDIMLILKKNRLLGRITNLGIITMNSIVPQITSTTKRGF